MPDCIDTTILVAAMVGDERNHDSCRRLVAAGKMALYSHGLTETFSTLTGGRRSFRLAPALATKLLVDSFAPILQITTLTPTEIMRAMAECELRGVRGGAVFDLLHLWAARKAKAERIYTLNVSHFRALHRPGDPEIVHP